MKKIVEIKFGSHLYGTSTPASDLDIKGIYLPSAEDILLQQVTPTININRVKAQGEKNTAEDIDLEMFTPARFLQLVAEGQTIALDMLFAPNDCILAYDPLWQEIKSIAHKLVNKKATAFIGYCRKQAHKYGAKGDRLALVRQCNRLLTSAEDQYGTTAKLEIIRGAFLPLVKESNYISFGATAQPDGSQAEYIEICGKKALFGASIKLARTMSDKLLNDYGARARAAETNNGVDWKALSHAVRIANEAIELLDTKKITFPRPEAAHLLAIKQGKLPYEEVAREIDMLLAQVEQAEANSQLQNGFDQKLINEFVIKLHREVILNTSAK